jgi:hypothetical protein
LAEEAVYTLERDDPGSGDNRGAIRLLSEPVDALPVIPLAPLTGQAPGWRPSEITSPVMRLNDLRRRVRMTWSDETRGWIATSSDVVGALQGAGFCECKHVIATSRRAGRPAGGAWQGVDPRTGSTASLVWMAHAVTQDAMVFIEIDGHAIS